MCLCVGRVGWWWWLGVGRLNLDCSRILATAARALASCLEFFAGASPLQCVVRHPCGGATIRGGPGAHVRRAARPALSAGATRHGAGPAAAGAGDGHRCCASQRAGPGTTEAGGKATHVACRLPIPPCTRVDSSCTKGTGCVWGGAVDRGTCDPPPPPPSPEYFSCMQAMLVVMPAPSTASLTGLRSTSHLV